jgi:hypothetical protein
VRVKGVVQHYTVVARKSFTSGTISFDMPIRCDTIKDRITDKVIGV